MFSDKQELEKFVARRPAFQEMLKEVLQAEGKMIIKIEIRIHGKE